MSVKIRLTRLGAPRKPTYRLVIADSRIARDGDYLESVGSYDPRTNPATIKINADRALYWLSQGVQPTETARELLASQGIWQRHLAAKKEKKEKKA
jgi:small subunit ribosomal protein S16